MYVCFIHTIYANRCHQLIQDFTSYNKTRALKANVPKKTSHLLGCDTLLYVSDPRCRKEPGIPATTVSTLEIASCNVISPVAVNLTDNRENGGSMNTFNFT